VIVDDERLARRELRSLLEAHPAIAVVGEAETVPTAAEVVRATEAEVVFLDVQLGTELGFELLPLLEPDVAVIFVTAHDKHAVRAFESNALDYLLKPVSKARLSRAIDRLASESLAAPGTATGPLDYDEFLFLRIDGRMRFLKLRTVAAIVAQSDHTTLKLVGGEAVRIRKSIGEWEARLPPHQFVRIHRSAIVNVDHVERIDDWFHAAYLVHVSGSKEPLHMSRRYAAALRDRFG
jgi:two-component system LytT family response regulator